MRQSDQRHLEHARRGGEVKYGRVDKLHADFRAYFKAHGCEWEDTSSVGKGFPDAIACAAGGSKGLARFPDLLMRVATIGKQSHWQPARIALIEIKSGAKAKTKPTTAKKQADFAARFPVWRISTLAEADELIKWLRS